MFHLVYMSRAVSPFSDAELTDLLRHAFEKNQRLGITGLLLYKRGTFMQALEGEETVVRALYRVISADPRHREVLTLLAIPVVARMFPSWSMGFKNISGLAAGSQPGYNPEPDLPGLDQELSWQTSVATRLLSGFEHSR